MRNRKQLWSALMVLASLFMGLVGPVGSVAQAGSTAGDDGAVVRTDRGPVKGTVIDGYRVFQGIPYAAPPVGDLRWHSPQPAKPWSTPRDATKPASRCPQVADPFFGTPASADEDCLYLNVTTPRSARHDRLKPVMVWIHGGGFIAGAGSDYDARRLAVGGDVVVVTINYRLGVLGLLGHPKLANSGNYGLEDQQAALRWVRRNAAAFGGDPDKVTLFGESAGGMATCAHLASPSAAGLFHRAVMQSGTCTMDWPDNAFLPNVPAGSPWTPLSEVEAAGSALATSVGCADPATAAACLRRVPVSKLLSVPPTPTVGVAYGTHLLPLNPARALHEGRFHRVPVMSGITRDEQRLFVALLWDHPITPERYRQLLNDAFGKQAEQVAARYPLSAYDSPALAWAAVTTDRIWACPTLTANRLFAKRTSVYGYEFADRNAPIIFSSPSLPIPLDAYHGSELAYLFDLGGVKATFTPDQQKLSDQMIRYWARFAATGDPNTSNVPHWPRFHHTGSKKPQVQSLAPAGAGGIRPIAFASEHHCDFWMSLGQKGR